MFLENFNLREQPFGTAPDSRFFLPTPSHREALASLWFNIQENRGICGIFGVPGMGKTTILTALASRLDRSMSVIMLLTPQCTAKELLQLILANLGLPPRQGMLSMFECVRRKLEEDFRIGHRYLLFVDEVQQLLPQALETVRLLSNLCHQGQYLLQIVLCGQPNFVKSLHSPALESFNQRITCRVVLNRFTERETAAYINGRLELAGGYTRQLFSAEAVQLIWQASGGIPRNINSLCFGALSIACALRRQTVNGAIAREAIDDRDMARALERELRPRAAAPIPINQKPFRVRVHAMTLAAAIMLLVIAVGISTDFMVHRYLSTRLSSTPTATATSQHSQGEMGVDVDKVVNSTQAAADDKSTTSATSPHLEQDAATGADNVASSTVATESNKSTEGATR